jgi:hypothetical protein
MVMTAEWHPVAQARPVEWVMSAGPTENYAVIRELDYGNANRPDVYFRVVTWAPTSESRRLVGYTRTLAEAAQLAWDYRRAYAGLRHHYASRRADMSVIDKLSEDPAELVRFWRQQTASRGTTPDAPGA